MAGSNHKVSIVVGVQDLASRALRSIQNSVNSMHKGFGTAGTLMGAFNRNLDTSIMKLDRLANSMYKFNMYTSALQRNLRNVTLMGGAVAGGLAVQGTNKALDYDYKTRIMQSRMEASNGTRENISRYILNDLNYKTAYKPTEIADMGIILGQAGINNSKDMKAMLKTVSYFSEAVDAVPEQAAEMVIAAAKGFNISMEKSGDITDKLTVALNKSLLHTEELPHAIGELSGRANMFGQSLDSSLVALMTMRDQGITAAQGAQDFLHGLRQASRIGNDETLFKRTKGYFDSLGVTNAIFNKDTRQLKEFPELIADMEKAMIKQRYINPKYAKQVTDDKSFREFLSKNGGAAPKDFWDSEKAMPLISRVFGAAGQTPIIAGLQTKYEEVNKETGEKTGNVYYGSDALKKMFEDVKNSGGAVDKTHEIISGSGKFQLDVLSGAWEAAQIKLMDGLVPLIKTGAEELTRFFNPNAGIESNRKPGEPLNMDQYDYKSPLDNFKESLDKTVKNFEKEHPAMAPVVETVGNKIIDGVQISKTLPSMFSQIGGAFNKDIVNADWGDSIVEFPWAIVKNGTKFITDLLKANEEFNKAVENLPQDLQDPAKLVETLAKGGIILMVTGAVVKTIELGIRGVSTALTVAKTGTKMTEAIIAMFTGKKGKGGGGVLSEILGKNMTVKANIVNVYGSTVTGGGPGGGGRGTPPVVPTGGGGGGVPPVVPFATRAGNFAKGFLKYGVPTLIISDMLSGASGGPSVTKKLAESEKNPLNPQTDKKIDEMHKILKDPSSYSGPKKPGETEIVPESNFFKPKKAEKEESKLAPAQDTQALTNVKFPAVERMNEFIDKKMGKMLNYAFPGDSNKKVNIEDFKNFATSTKETTFNIENSILSGFNTANDRLQNLKLQNAVSVMVQPPQVVVSGDIKDIVNVKSQGSSSFQVREEQNGTAWDRMNQIGQRRTGWR